MKYYIVKKGDSIDNILNKFGMSYQKFISLNNIDIKNKLIVGSKIIVETNINDRSFKDNINKIYQGNRVTLEDENNIICPYCKNIITFPKQ